jgi:hypothetical protein
MLAPHAALQLYPVAESCGTVTSGYRRKCCRTKLANGEEADDWCKENYAEVRRSCMQPMSCSC